MLKSFWLVQDMKTSFLIKMIATKLIKCSYCSKERHVMIGTNREKFNCCGECWDWENDEAKFKRKV
jgi:hypothetical protein